MNGTVNLECLHAIQVRVLNVHENQSHSTLNGSIQLDFIFQIP